MKDGRNSIIVHNTHSTATLYLGGSDVTADSELGTTSGYELAPNSFFNLDISDDIILYARTNGTTIRVKVTEVA